MSIHLGLESAWQQIRGAIGMFLSASPVARGVMNEMLAEYKILTSQLFITELTLYYKEIVSKTGGDPPHSKEVKESCWGLVTKLLRTIFKEFHKVRRFAAEAVSIGSDSLMTNGMFLYAALEELQVLRKFATCDWRNHPKFNQSSCPAPLRNVSATRHVREQEGGVSHSQDQHPHGHGGAAPDSDQGAGVWDWGASRESWPPTAEEDQVRKGVLLRGGG
jgi:hypothetical protein